MFCPSRPAVLCVGDVMLLMSANSKQLFPARQLTPGPVLGPGSVGGGVL